MDKESSVNIFIHPQSKKIIRKYTGIIDYLNFFSFFRLSGQLSSACFPRYFSVFKKLSLHLRFFIAQKCSKNDNYWNILISGEIGGCVFFGTMCKKIVFYRWVIVEEKVRGFLSGRRWNFKRKLTAPLSNVNRLTLPLPKIQKTYISLTKHL